MTIRLPFFALLSMAFVVPGTLAGERGRPAGPRTEGRLGASFRKLDRDGDGRLSFSEWHRTRRGAEVMPSKALELFRTSDLNRNQRLSPYEFGRSQGIRISLPNSHSNPGGRGEGSRGATFTTGSAGGSGSSVTNSVADTLTLSSGGTTAGTLDPLTLLTAPGTTDSSGNTILDAGPLSLSGGGTFHVGMLPVGTIQGGNLVISGTFSRYVGLTLEAATALADSESRASRVVSIDGVRQVVTADWSPTRVNFFLVDGIVKLAIGG